MDTASPACLIVNIRSNEEISFQGLSKIITNVFDLPDSLPLIDYQIVDRYLRSITMAKSIGCSVDFQLALAISATVSSIQEKS